MFQGVEGKKKASTHLTKKKMGFEQSHMAATDHNPELIDCSWSPQFAGSYGNHWEPEINLYAVPRSSR